MDGARARSLRNETNGGKPPSGGEQNGGFLESLIKRIAVGNMILQRGLVFYDIDVYTK